VKKYRLAREFRKRQACYFVSKNIVDEFGNILICVAIQNEVGYLKTNETIGRNLQLARELMRKRNTRAGIRPEKCKMIVQSSIDVQNEMNDLIKEVEEGD